MASRQEFWRQAVLRERARSKSKCDVLPASISFENGISDTFTSTNMAHPIEVTGGKFNALLSMADRTTRRVKDIPYSGYPDRTPRIIRIGLSIFIHENNWPLEPDGYVRYVEISGRYIVSFSEKFATKHQHQESTQ